MAPFLVLRKAIRDVKTSMVGALHLRNGFSWNHMFGIAEDVREALKREESDYHERNCVGYCNNMACMLARSEGNDGSTRKRKLNDTFFQRIQPWRRLLEDKGSSRGIIQHRRSCRKIRLPSGIDQCYGNRNIPWERSCITRSELSFDMGRYWISPSRK